MDRQRIKTLLKQSEGPKLDFKEKLDISTESGKKELAKDVIAIANTQGGRGHILVGVRDKSKELIGIDPKLYGEERIQQVLTLRCDPPITVRVEHILYESVTLLLITIFRSSNKPHQMLQTGAFYVRRGSTTDLARRDEIAGMLQYNGLLHNEQVPMVQLSEDALSEELIEAYLKKRHLEDEPNRKKLLEELGILHYDLDIGKYFPTLGALILFCENPELYMPHLSIKIVNALEGRRDVTHISGNVLRQAQAINDYIQKELSPWAAYPFEALKEGIYNAMLHRDYFDLSRKIVITLGADYTEISNPGAIFGNERLSELMRQQSPPRRNHWLYHQLLAYGSDRPFKGTGNGLALINDSFEEGQKVKFINLRKSNTFKLILPGLSLYKQKDKE